ncbi:MAG: glutamine amidotransferase [Actinomycetes bacterium]
MSLDTLMVVEVFPSLLQPEGDHGNVVILTDRAHRRGVDVDVLIVHPGDDLPDDAQLYLIGGSTDSDLTECARRLRSGGELTRAVAAGAAVLGVGAGYQVLSQRFDDPDGLPHDGVGLLDVEMSHAPWAKGPVVTAPSPALGLPQLSGYEYHCSGASLGPDVLPLAALEIGVGNGERAGANHDGAVSGRVIGTWLHGPLLPRNPEVADLLLRWVGVDVTPLDDSAAHEARTIRIREARAG